MKIICVWILDLLSNFRLHIAVISILLIVLSGILLSNAILMFVFLTTFLYALFPLSSWINKPKHCNSQKGKTFDVCSFNVQWNANEHVKSLKYIEESKADILVLQEVTEALRKEINEYLTSFPHQVGEGHSHVMVLSKHKLEFVNYLAWPGKFQNRAMHVKCNINDLKVNILAIHLQVTRSWKEIELREKQIDMLKASLANIDGPVIVAGDFNSGIGSTVLRKIEKETNLRSLGSLLDYLRTWPANYGLLAIQLDHCYVKHSLVVSNIVMGPKLDSDHMPIMAKIKCSSD